MRFLSVCSGIEAASVAWNPLGWEAVAFSEIEPFPCAVLAHHYPSVPNWGDMTKFQEWPDADVDLLCGGTPCQSFSVAGLRKGLADPRGNLMLTFGAIAAKYRPRWLVWENVPGVLSSNGGRDFGAFLGMLGQLGYGFAYRVLDAQYFGVPQRRRRVFVVGCLGDWRRAAAVLFERHSMSGDSAPSRESGKVAPTIPSRSLGGGGLGTDFDCDGGLIVRSVALRGREGGGTAELGDEVQNCLRASSGGGDKPHVLCMAHGQGGAEDPCVSTDAAFALGRNNGGENVLAFDTTQITSAENRSNPQPGGPCHPLSAGAHPPAIAIQAGALRTNPASGPDGIGVQADLAYTLEARSEVQAVAFAQNQLGEVRSGEVFNTLNTNSNASGRNTPMVATVAAPVEHEALYNKGFNHGGNYASTQETHAGKILRALREAVGEEAFAKWGLGILDSLQSPEILRQALHGVSIRPAPFSRSWVVHGALSRQEDGPGWLLQSLRETGCEGCPPQGWEPPEQLNGELRAYLQELSQPGAQASRFMRDLWWAAQGAGLLRQALSAVQEMGRPTHGQSQPAHGDMQVRRLTVEECEFLQGFPRGYTLIPWRKKPSSECPDGPRYRALGNSWAIPVVRWIGQRIDSVLSRGQTRPSHVEAAQKRSTPESGEQRRDRTGS